MSPAVVPSHAPRLTAAQRKEALELRKATKPLMEKRRRARINDCLSRLESLIVPLAGKDVSGVDTRHSKLEKADVLEMTVRFLSGVPPGPATGGYREGYAACLRRVSALLPRTSLDGDACRRLEGLLRQSTSAPRTPTCPNCCAQSPSGFPRIQQRLLSLKSGAGPDGRARGGGAAVPVRAPQSPQVASAAVWRPW